MWPFRSCAIFLVAVGLLTPRHSGVVAFSPSQRTKWCLSSRSYFGYFGSRHGLHGNTDKPNSAAAEYDFDKETGVNAVRVPLSFIGPYPCISLRFPKLATSSQQSRNVTGISLDFVLDTAANTNTINAQVASELALEVVGTALPGVGAGGTISGGDTYMLGDCELDGLPPGDNFTFMTDLTASALPLASPAAAGLLGVYFFNAFTGGVEFSWGDSSTSTPASLTFYADVGEMDSVLSGLGKIEVSQLPDSGLPSITINVNGVAIPALFDTGSPITVFNAEAAKLAGIHAVEVEGQEKSKNPFARLTQGLKSAQAVARGDIVMIAGANGNSVELLKSKSKVDISSGNVKIGKSGVFIGDLPGLKALGGLGATAPPAVVLGMDFLCLRPRVIYRANEVFM